MIRKPVNQEIRLRKNKKFSLILLRPDSFP